MKLWVPEGNRGNLSIDSSFRQCEPFLGHFNSDLLNYSINYDSIMWLVTHRIFPGYFARGDASLSVVYRRQNDASDLLQPLCRPLHGPSVGRRSPRSPIAVGEQIQNDSAGADARTD